MARILVVEDNPVMADGIRDVLELAGHDVCVAGDGAEGLKLVARVGPELIISDVMMPNMDGFRFYQAVRANPAWVFVPFIFLTARSQTEDVLLGKRLGADDYVVKPYDPEVLVATVDARLARSRAVSRAAACEMENLKRSITRVVGHELRTPLTWIQGYAELLLGNANCMTPEELQQSLLGIKAGSDRLARLVEDAVMVTMLGAGQAREEFALAARSDDDLISHVRQVISSLQPEAAEHQVRLELRAPERVAPVVLAPRFFSEALLHLIENGIKFARAGADSYVAVTVEDRRQEVELTVSDNGLGIPADQVQHIFEPLVQVDRSAHEQQGAGLGLAVARGLVELHDGRIWAESQLGQGTTVHFALPHAPAA